MSFSVRNGCTCTMVSSANGNGMVLMTMSVSMSLARTSVRVMTDSIVISFPSIFSMLSRMTM